MLWDPVFSTVHRGTFCQSIFQWIQYYDSNKSTGLESGKSHLCAMYRNLFWPWEYEKTTVLAKLKTFSVLHWQPNLLKNSKRARFIWVLGIYNFGLGVPQQQFNCKIGRRGPIVGRPHLKIVRSDNDGLDLSIHISWKLRRRASKWL